MATVATPFFLRDGLGAGLFGDGGGELAVAEQHFLVFLFLIRTGLFTCLVEGGTRVVGFLGQERLDSWIVWD